jgi:hypothetical protein
MFESKSGVLLIAGLGFFALAFVSNAVVPWVMYADQKELTVKEMIEAPTGVNVLNQFENLEDRYPEAFRKVYGEPPPLQATVVYDGPDVEGQLKTHDEALNKRTEWFKEKCATALLRGRDVYIGEACWHCHSQFVRPVSNEEQRFGEVAKSWEFNNELQRPVMFGTRRVGPDLSREAGRRGNDWHYNHFFRPRRTSPESVMPDYPWFYDHNTSDGPGDLNERGFAIITYMQWLGSWLDSYPHYHEGNVIYHRGQGGVKKP